MPAARSGSILALSILFGALLVSCGSPEAVATGTPAAKPATATIRIPSPSRAVTPVEDAPVAPLASGANHTCVLTIGHGAACWGNNRNGQLGNGTQLSSGLPQQVSRMTSGVLSIAAGWSHACALRAGGGLECWGSNAKGQLGDGTNADSFSPVAVFGLAEGVKAVAAGTRHTCVLMGTGGVKCWGENASGGLGDGTNINRNVPVEVPGLEAGVKALDAGAGHTCALMSDGSVKCWGWNPCRPDREWNQDRQPAPGRCHRAARSCARDLGRRSAHLRAARGRIGHVLGRERERAAGRRLANPQRCSGCRRRLVRCRCGVGRRRSYLRVAGGWDRLVLGR